MKPPTTPKGRQAKAASEQAAKTTITAAAGAPTDANVVAPDAGGQADADVVAAAAAAAAVLGADQATGAAGVAPADGQAPADQATVAPTAPAAAGITAPITAVVVAAIADVVSEGDGTISGIEAAKLTIRDFARTEDGEIARDSRGRAVVEERPLRETDILGDRVDGDIVHFVLADGRKISVRK
ncbi:hypothetical protein [Inquilinus sp. CA228]|uniref:hypothetical protein n=1 Tax=Inquilinus sp. CA228 TaxID=3455609 RepID=UPI003F8D2FB0